jgi:TonB-linked SusC/RagA family outer membrane protein
MTTLVTILACSIVSIAGVADRTVKGTVKDNNGNPIIGAIVQVKGATVGVTTGDDGSFSVNVPDNATLIVSHVSYETAEIVVGTQTTIDVVLNESAEMLDELVVVGFGTQKKVNLTGAVGVTTAKELKERPVMLASQALQGLVPGLLITQKDGSMGDRPAITIRGTGTVGQGSTANALILIDGVEGSIDALNPQDIESVSVLKDASASSIYGSRAPFGVILITTKSGKAGRLTVNYNNSLQWGKPTNRPEVMDSWSWAVMYNEACANSGAGLRFNDETLQRIRDYQDGKLTTSNIEDPGNPGYWGDGRTYGNNNQNVYDIIYKDWLFSQSHNLNLSGGNDKATYYSSVEYLDKNGLLSINNDTYDRYAGTMKLNFKPTGWLQLNSNVRFVREDASRPSSMADLAYFFNMGAESWPMNPVYDPNGFLTNGTMLALEQGGKYKSQTDNIILQEHLLLEPVKNWKTHVDFSYRITNSNATESRTPIERHKVNGDEYVANAQNGLSESQSKNNYINLNVRSEYTYVAGSHTIFGMVGFQSEQENLFAFSANRQGLIIYDMPVLNLTTGRTSTGSVVPPGVSGARNHWATAGFFGRINYDYKQKYLLEANLRYDATSRFREDKRWIWLPSFSAGWNVAKEDFWQSLTKYVNLLKFRFSFGELGNQNTSSLYPTYATISPGSANGAWLINGARPNTVGVAGRISASLGWERVRSYNFGLDIGAFNNRLTGSFDYFNRYTLGMVGPGEDLPFVIGTGVPPKNGGELKTYGFELSIGWNDRLSNGLEYGVKVLLSDAQSVVKKYYNPTATRGTYYEGEKLNKIWGYTTVGIAKTQDEMDAHLASLPNGGQTAINGQKWGAGDIMYKDLNGDGKISNGNGTWNDTGDLSIIGNSTPRYSLGVELTAEWKGIDFRAFFSGVLKRDMYIRIPLFGMALYDFSSFPFAHSIDYFRDDPNSPLGLNIDSYFPRPYNQASNWSKNSEPQTRYLQNAAYVRMKNLQIGYTMPRSLTPKFIHSLRIFASGENLFEFDDLFKTFDPETVDGGRDVGISLGYPLMRTVSFGLNINF